MPMMKTTTQGPFTTITSKTISASNSSSERESEGSVRKKRRMTDYFESLMNTVLEKQENLQDKFLEAIEKCEKDRMARQEAWRAEEMARIKREQETLAHLRAVAAANDAAVTAFLQSISNTAIPVKLAGMMPVSVEHVRSSEMLVENNDDEVNFTDKDVDKEESRVVENSSQASSSRWPKAEVEALVRLKSNFDLQYRENGSKGPLWEEISSAMKKLGYDRSDRKCKEKWENIKKYYKRVKESNRKRPEDSRTCPYFHLLESLYGNKSNVIEQSSDSSGCNLRPEYILMQMMGQDQQQEQQQQQQQQSATEEDKSENIHQSQENNQVNDEDGSGDGYLSVAINPSLVAIMDGTS